MLDIYALELLDSFVALCLCTKGTTSQPSLTLPILLPVILQRELHPLPYRLSTSPRSASRTSVDVKRGHDCACMGVLFVPVIPYVFTGAAQYMSLWVGIHSCLSLFLCVARDICAPSHVAVGRGCRTGVCAGPRTRRALHAKIRGEGLV